MLGSISQKGKKGKRGRRKKRKSKKLRKRKPKKMLCYKSNNTRKLLKRHKKRNHKFLTMCSKRRIKKWIKLYK